MAEKRYQLETSTGLTPGTVFKRAWAMKILVRVREQLGEHYKIPMGSQATETSVWTVPASR